MIHVASFVARRAALPLLAASPLALVAGNLAILAAHRHARDRRPQAPIPASIPGVKNRHVVDARVWRGSAPHALATYRALAAAGVTTIVDLRAERHLRVPDDAALAALGIRRLAIPIRDGQIPTERDIDAFLAAVKASPGKVYVHCGAGVGRTGSMAAAYLVATGQATGAEAVRRSLAVGPPSLEQIWFMRGLVRGRYRRPPAPLVALSRLLDAPRRIRSRLRQAMAAR